MDELEKISKENDGNWVAYNPNNIPDWFVDSPYHDKPDKIIHPSRIMIYFCLTVLDSHVLKIRASEIVPSDKYGSKMTLRFPRFIDFREDKHIDDAMTLTQAQKRYETNKGKMLNPFKSSITEPDAYKKRKIVKKASVVSVERQLLAQDLSSVEMKQKLFDGYQFCVFTNVKYRSKLNIERDLKSYHADIVQNPPKILPADKIFMVISETANGVKVGNVIKANRVDIIKPQYIYDCISAGYVSYFLNFSDHRFEQ